ncbi:MAG: T9SS type A sorting domain-containing protein [Bacteroidia bacterium]
MKKNFYLKMLAFLFVGAMAQSASATGTIPIDTTHGRYYTQVFSSVTITSGVTYGSNTDYTGSPVTLTMDIYQPVGDTVSQRPVLVFAHGGSFVGGASTDQDVTSLCTTFAKMGYVTASINYRLGFYPFDSIHAVPAVIRAVQDMKAAVRFFRKDFATTNTYKVQPNYVFAGGSSAGAFMALHLAYLTQNSEVPSYVNIASLGGLEGTSGNPGYSDNVNGVVNLCGALGDSAWIKTGAIPFVSMQGDSDHTVPYGSSIIVVAGNPIMRVDGSHSLHLRATHVGVPNPFYTFYNADHVPYAGSTAAEIAYMDTTVNFVKIFLRPLLVQPSVTTVPQLVQNNDLTVYPNPSQGDVFIQFSKNNTNQHLVQLYDVAGKQLLSSQFNGSFYAMQRGTIAPGIYFLKITDTETAHTSIKKIIFY